MLCSCPVRNSCFAFYIFKNQQTHYPTVRHLVPTQSCIGEFGRGSVTHWRYESVYLSSTDPERWTNIPLLVKIFKLIINELSTVMEANASRANVADWSQGESA